MRKNIKVLGGAIVSVAILSVVAATPNVAAPGEPGSSDIIISGSVPAITVLPPTPDTGVTAMNATLSGNTVSITTLADDEAHLTDSSIILQYSGVTTNYPTTIELISAHNGLKNGGDTVKYSAEASFGIKKTGLCEFEITPTPCKVPIGQSLNNSIIKIIIKTELNPNHLLQYGVYSDTLTLKIGSGI